MVIFLRSRFSLNYLLHGFPFNALIGIPFGDVTSEVNTDVITLTDANIYHFYSSARGNEW